MVVMVEVALAGGGARGGGGGGGGRGGDGWPAHHHHRNMGTLLPSISETDKYLQLLSTLAHASI